jgi:hypothetical protein
MQLLPHPVGPQQVIDDPRSRRFLRDLNGSEPRTLTPDEAVTMLALVGFDPPLPG